MNEERNEALGLVVALPREDDPMTILRTESLAEINRETEDWTRILDRYGKCRHAYGCFGLPCV